MCIRDDCDNLVIGDGPGCHLHRRDGRHHSEETRAKMRGGPPVEKVCEWCGEPFVGRGDRFCGKPHDRPAVASTGRAVTIVSSAYRRATTSTATRWRA